MPERRVIFSISVTDHLQDMDLDDAQYAEITRCLEPLISNPASGEPVLFAKYMRGDRMIECRALSLLFIYEAHGNDVQITDVQQAELFR